MRQPFDIARKKFGLRAPLASRTVAWMIAGALVFTALFRVALPLFVSTASVKTNMEQALSSWTGAQASIVGDPDISFWPQPTLTLHSVRFEGGDAKAPELLAKVDAITAGFDLLAALRGNPVFYDFNLVNPVFKVERRADGTLNWRRTGWMADAIASARAQTAPIAHDTPIGDIEIENGTLELTDLVTNSAHRIANVSGAIQWPTPAARVSANLSAVMNGEKVEWSVICEEPMTLLSGRSGAIRTSFASALLNVHFDGTASGFPQPLASGRLQLTAGSIPALAAWYGAKTSAAVSPGAIAIDTGMTLSAETLKMDDLSLSLDGSSATGVLDISWSPRNSPRIDGTLAFDRFDTSSLLASLWLLLPEAETGGRLPDMTFLKHIGIDLRLSAQEASYGAFVVNDVAAGVIAENGRASIDIGDGTYSGGSLSGRMALANDGINGGELQFSLKNADLGAVAADFGLGGPLPLGRGVLSVDLTTADPVSALTTSGISGSVRYSAIDGTLTNFNVTEFERLATKGAFFEAREAGDGSFAFTTADIHATLRGGVADLVKADIKGEGRTLSLAGAIPYRSGSLALAGAIIRPENPALQPVRFFIGGSWPNPIISPLSTIPAAP